MIPIVTPAEMREIDANAAEPVDTLIERAGWFVARRARAMLAGVYGRRVTVIAGPGNNGADALVAARLLSSWGVRVEVIAPDGIATQRAGLYIDGAFGTGANRAYEPRWDPAGARVLAIDIPSGVSGETGECLGSPIRADETVTFAALKPGLLQPPGSDLGGRVEVVDIGLDTSAASRWLFGAADAAQALPRAATADHKWKRAVWVVGGSSGMYGAPLLASQAALRSGSGLVWCGVPGQSVPALASEVVFRALDSSGWHSTVLESIERFGAAVVGPGLGRSPEAAASVQALVEATDCPLVIDGDALRLLGKKPALRPSIVLTPHDGEFQALTGHAPGLDRFEAAKSLASATGATALLKGPLTIVAEPGGRCLASAAGDQRLATAGSGDVLAGVVGSYLAAGVEPATAAVLAAFMHGHAGRTQPAVGMIASDLLAGLPQVAERLVHSDPADLQEETYAPN